MCYNKTIERDTINQKERRKMKIYFVRYYIKANNTEFERTMTLLAKSAKEACSICKIAVKIQTGRNAFRPVARSVAK